MSTTPVTAVLGRLADEPIVVGARWIIRDFNGRVIDYANDCGPMTAYRLCRLYGLPYSRARRLV